MGTATHPKSASRSRPGPAFGTVVSSVGRLGPANSSYFADGRPARRDRRRLADEAEGRIGKRPPLLVDLAHAQGHGTIDGRGRRTRIGQQGGRKILGIDAEEQGKMVVRRTSCSRPGPCGISRLCRLLRKLRTGHHLEIARDSIGRRCRGGPRPSSAPSWHTRPLRPAIRWARPGDRPRRAASNRDWSLGGSAPDGRPWHRRRSPGLRRPSPTRRSW